MFLADTFIVRPTFCHALLILCRPIKFLYSRFSYIPFKPPATSAYVAFFWRRTWKPTGRCYLWNWNVLGHFFDDHLMKSGYNWNILRFYFARFQTLKEFNKNVTCNDVCTYVDLLINELSILSCVQNECNYYTCYVYVLLI